MITIPSYQSTIKELKTCYNTHADKFSSTRKKHRPELTWILSHIKTLSTQPTIQNNSINFSKKSKKDTNTDHGLHIIDLGCGDWRLYNYLTQAQVPIISYTGIDISDQLIAKAKESIDDTPASRIIDDMIHGLSQISDESIDVIISHASFQHLPDIHSRTIVLQHIYRVLRYGGKYITVDRSRSLRMIKKHRKPLLQALRTSLLSGWKNQRNNLMIPFSNGEEDKNQSYDRLYHIFTRPELHTLLQLNSFVIEEIAYSNQNGKFHHNRQEARNICTVVRKDIFVNPQSS